MVNPDNTVPAAEQATASESTDALVIRFLGDEAKQSELGKKRKRAQKAGVGSESALLPNRYLVLALDNSLRNGTVVGLSKFSPTDRPVSLCSDEDREIMEVPPSERVEGVSDRRSMIVDAVTRVVKRPEIPRQPGRITSPTLHKTLDQGSIGWPAAVWTDFCLQLRGTSTEDKWHRWHNDMKDALVASGCWLTICEKTVVYNVATAPWGGHAFHGVVSGAARQYFAERDEKCPLFQMMYKDILRMSPGALTGVGVLCADIGSGIALCGCSFGETCSGYGV